MLNKIIIMGRLTADVELRRTNTGTPVASFTLACDRDFGEKETDFIEVVAWKNTAEFVSKYFGKGRMAVVSGRLQIRKWQDKDGNKRSTAEVVADNVYFGDSKNTTENSTPKSQYTSMNDNWHDPNRQQTIDALRGNQDYAVMDEPDFGLPF